MSDFTETISGKDRLPDLERLKNGDERILSKLYNLYFDKLMYYGMQQLNDEFSVTNIIHECFIKAWNYRATMQRIEHFYYFTKLNMKWHFRKCYGSAGYAFYRSTYLTDKPEEQFEYIPELEEDLEYMAAEEEQLESIYKVIPLLPMTRSNVILLHYKYGLSFKAIAKRVGLTNKRVIEELQKSVQSIKSLLSVKETGNVITTKARDILINTDELCSKLVIRLRQEESLGFEEIAGMYKVSRATVVKLYIDGIGALKAS